jgi:hypothetical protein
MIAAHIEVRALGFGKSAEEKAAEQAAKEQQAAEAARAQAAADQAKAEAAYLAGPVGQAATAKQQKQGFYEVQLTVGSSQRTSSMFTTNPAGSGGNRVATHAGMLAAIEAIGWRLEHVGYVFMITGESSSDRILGTGQNTAVSGETVGIYLFRNTDPA